MTAQDDGRHETNDGGVVHRELMRLVDQAVMQARAVLLVTCKTDPGKGYEVDHIRLNCADLDTVIVMLGQLVEMIVEGTDTSLLDVLRALRDEVEGRKRG